LIAGGEVCLAAAARGGGRIVPVDSEHAAIAQCLEGIDPKSVTRICLTASGGPFRQRANLSNVTVEEALAHPTWDMGPKITIDCATLMNKGLEVIEAHFLFDVAFDRIDILVHPQSVVHGMVTFADGSVVMQAAVADMRLPLQAVLLGTERVASAVEPIDLATVGSLSFEAVDHERFPSVELAYQAGTAGGTSPAVLNAANEEAVRGFLEARVRFIDIPSVVEETLAAHTSVDAGNLETVLEVDAWARDHARGVIETRPRGVRRVVERVLGRTQ
jgi:1-deoxy-D-xylulose-5-phosphate reductoisomerase